MTVMNMHPNTKGAGEGRYAVVHPCFDAPEEKFDVDKLGPMRMTPAVKFSLLGLRAYLILMAVLAAYKFVGMSGVLGHLAG